MGRFTVQSAYRHAKNMSARMVASSSVSSSTGQDALWPTIWGSKIPPRVKTFMWRLCMGALPTLENLGRRKLGIVTLCPICDSQVETVTHIFLQCPFARQIWALSCIPWKCLSEWNQGVENWIMQVVREVSVVDKDRFFTLCWIIWQKRCKKLMENRQLDPMSTWREAEVLLESYQRVKCRVSPRI
ncbi:UNVERIFIED_CONTAM: hypothetical protein Slati_0471800 [Sesamum latifolium]|uniref:Reverse transcriptase zinc-binding domain-containing protein n=1 Tax=Sesamum latifolium TaxID=2727402 RepID=A0AAW2XZU6_9LAMI